MRWGVTFIGCLLAFGLFGLTIGALLFSYSVFQIFGATLPWWVNLVGGVFAGEVLVPVALVLWLLSLVGIHGPFVK